MSQDPDEASEIQSLTPIRKEAVDNAVSQGVHRQRPNLLQVHATQVPLFVPVQGTEPVVQAEQTGL